MLFHLFCFVLLCMERLESVEQECISEKRLLDVYTGYLFVSCVDIFTGFILIFWRIGRRKIFIFGLCIALCLYRLFFSNLLDYFKFSVLINYILTSSVFLNDTGFVTELHFTKSYHC